MTCAASYAVFGRMLSSRSPNISMRWGNPPISPLTSVGWSGLSCFSLAICSPWQPKRANYTCGADDIQVQLVFYRTFKARSLSPWFCQEEALWKL